MIRHALIMFGFIKNSKTNKIASFFFILRCCLCIVNSTFTLKEYAVEGPQSMNWNFVFSNYSLTKITDIVSLLSNVCGRVGRAVRDWGLGKGICETGWRLGGEG